MKRVLYALLCLSFIAVVSGMGLFWWLDHTEVDRSVRRLTGIETYRIIDKRNSRSDMYARVSIGENDSKKLFARYPFRAGFSKHVLAGKLDESHTSECPSCWSYFDEMGRGPYGYVLFVLSNNKRELTVYEVYAD